MDGGRFDGLARVLASSKTRRGYVVAALGVLGVSGLAVRGSSEASQASCRDEGESCTLTTSCCGGNVCVRTSLFNPNVGVCEPGSSVTSTPSRRTPTPTPRPTNTPSPTPIPTADRTILVPLTIRLNCAAPPSDQSIAFVGHFGRRRRFSIRIVSFRSFLGQSVGGAIWPGPRLTRTNRDELWRWQCTAPIPGTTCFGQSPLFSNALGTDGARFRIRYEGVECEALISCAQGSNPNNELPCVRV